jgi:hypothetical protein
LIVFGEFGKVVKPLYQRCLKGFPCGKTPLFEAALTPT